MLMTMLAASLNNHVLSGLIAMGFGAYMMLVGYGLIDPGHGSRTSQADIQGAQAAVRVAQLNLEYTQIRAPITGRASRAS